MGQEVGGSASVTDTYWSGLVTGMLEGLEHPTPDGLPTDWQVGAGCWGGAQLLCIHGSPGLLEYLRDTVAAGLRSEQLKESRQTGECQLLEVTYRLLHCPTNRQGSFHSGGFWEAGPLQPPVRLTLILEFCCSGCLSRNGPTSVSQFSQVD